MERDETECYSDDFEEDHYNDSDFESLSPEASKEYDSPPMISLAKKTSSTQGSQGGGSLMGTAVLSRSRASPMPQHSRPMSPGPDFSLLHRKLSSVATKQQQQSLEPTAMNALTILNTAISNKSSLAVSAPRSLPRSPGLSIDHASLTKKLSVVAMERKGLGGSHETLPQASEEMRMELVSQISTPALVNLGGLKEKLESLHETDFNQHSGQMHESAEQGLGTVCISESRPRDKSEYSAYSSDGFERDTTTDVIDSRFLFQGEPVDFQKSRENSVNGTGLGMMDLSKLSCAQASSTTLKEVPLSGCAESPQEKANKMSSIKQKSGDVEGEDSQTIQNSMPLQPPIDVHETSPSSTLIQKIPFQTVPSNESKHNEEDQFHHFEAEPLLELEVLHIEDVSLAGSNEEEYNIPASKSSSIPTGSSPEKGSLVNSLELDRETHAPEKNQREPVVAPQDNIINQEPTPPSSSPDGRMPVKMLTMDNFDDILCQTSQYNVKSIGDLVAAIGENPIGNNPASSKLAGMLRKHSLGDLQAAASKKHDLQVDKHSSKAPKMLNPNDLENTLQQKDDTDSNSLLPPVLVAESPTQPKIQIGSICSEPKPSYRKLTRNQQSLLRMSQQVVAQQCKHHGSSSYGGTHYKGLAQSQNFRSLEHTSKVEQRILRIALRNLLSHNLGADNGEQQHQGEIKSNTSSRILNHKPLRRNNREIDYIQRSQPLLCRRTGTKKKVLFNGFMGNNTTDQSTHNATRDEKNNTFSVRSSLNSPTKSSILETSSKKERSLTAEHTDSQLFSQVYFSITERISEMAHEFPPNIPCVNLNDATQGKIDTTQKQKINRAIVLSLTEMLTNPRIAQNLQKAAMKKLKHSMKNTPD